MVLMPRKSRTQSITFAVTKDDILAVNSALLKRIAC